MDEFKPDYAVPVGEIIEEELQCRGIKKVDFARNIGKSAKWVSEFISGKAPLTVKTALEIESVSNLNAQTLMNMETRHRIFEARQERIK